MRLRFYGQSCFLIDLGNTKLLFDPALSVNPLSKDLDINKIEADYILLSHAHADHVADVEQIAKNTGAKIISNYEIVSHYGQKGFEGHPLNHGGKWNFDFGTVRFVNAVHSSVLPDGSYGGNPGGFVITHEDKTFYFAGDTALTWDMKLIPMLYPKLNFAILPIGDNFTMGYEDAVIASDFIECNKIVGCHFDSFGYIKIDHEQAKKAFSDKSKELILMDIGKDINL